MGCDIANPTVKANFIVMSHIICHCLAGVFDGPKRCYPNAVTLYRAMVPLDLAVALGIVR